MARNTSRPSRQDHARLESAVARALTRAVFFSFSPQLRNEVKDEIFAHNGRINMTELAPMLRIEGMREVSEAAAALQTLNVATTRFLHDMLSK